MSDLLRVVAREHPGGESEDPTAPPVAGGAV